MKKILILLTCLLSLSLTYSASIEETNTFDDSESFEDGIPSTWTVSDGSLSISTKRYKQGKQSLLWEWQAGSKLSITSELLSSVSTEKNSGIAFWLYNEAVGNDSIHICFYDTSNRLQCSFYYQLNATGWRSSWVRFWQDMTGNTDATTLARMEITAPPNGTGQLHIDIVEFKSSISYIRSPSYQYAPDYPYADNEDVKDDWECYLYEKKYPEAYLPLPDVVSAEEKAIFDTITHRYESWVLGSSKQSTLIDQRRSAMDKFISNGVELADDFIINQDADGVLTGLPLFSNNSKHGPKMGRDAGEKLLLQLALDYRINNSTASKDKLLLLFDYLHDQGWAAGSSMGSLDHQKLRMGAWVHAVFLMRHELAAQAWKDGQTKLDRELESLRWFSAFNILFAPEDDVIAVNVDDFRSTTLFRLLYILMMDNGNPQKVQYMNHYTQFLNRNLKLHEGWSDGIKPDGMGYHHRASYMNAYSNNGVHVMTQILYFMRHTPYDVNDESKENLKMYLLNYRISNHLYDVPKGVSGRITGIEKTATMMGPMVYLAHCFDEDTLDEELIAAMKRMWDTTADPVDDIIGKYAMSIMLHYTLGNIELLEEASNTDIAAEEYPQGFWIKPYAAMAIFRGDNWSTSIKGTSAYVWDFESGTGENTYGRYDSYGHMEIANNASSYSSVVKSGHDYNNGWDWSRIPGTTSVARTLDEMESDTHRTFSPNTFVGGVSHQGTSGLWAMEFEDVHYYTDLEFKKSVFCFAPNLMVCLGSDIDAKVVFTKETTLFQNVISSSNTSIYINENEITDKDYTYTPQNSSATIIDSNGKGIYVPDDANLNIQRETRSSETMYEKSSTGDVMTAWFDHSDTDNYEYAILMNTDNTQLVAFANSPSYEILEKDEKAHVVKCSTTGETGYAIFDASKRFTTGLIRESSIPIMAMTSGNDNEMILSLCNPDFNRAKPEDNGDIDTQDDLYGPYVPMSFEVKLSGHWKLSENNDKVTLVSEISNHTTLIIESYDAENIELVLINDTTNLNEYSKEDIIIAPNPASSEVYFPFCNKAIIYSPQGVEITRAESTNSMNIEQMASGYYIIKLFYEEYHKTFKLIKE